MKSRDCNAGASFQREEERRYEWDETLLVYFVGNMALGSVGALVLAVLDAYGCGKAMVYVAVLMLLVQVALNFVPVFLLRKNKKLFTLTGILMAAGYLLLLTAVLIVVYYLNNPHKLFL